MFRLFTYDLTKQQQKIIFLASMGGLLEFYDFTIYGLFSVYFASQFFPLHNGLLAIILSYSIFVVGYIVRPLGGIVFSHIGDELGRKKVLILTMLLMGIASCGMGLLPTYAQIGIYAPALMLLLRVIQGLAIGGELPSMIVYVAESMPGKRAYAMGGIFSGTAAGILPGMFINLVIVHYFTAAQVNNFGWRIPFLLGGLLCFIAYRIRRELHETAIFTALKTRNPFPFLELLHYHFTKLLIGIGLVSIMAAPIFLLIIFMPTYLIKIAQVNPAIVSSVILSTSLISVMAIYLMGILANKYNVYELMRSCLILVSCAALFCYYSIWQNLNLYLGLGVFAVFQGFLVTLAPILLSHLFPPHIRLTGVALSYNLSFVLFGGLTPIIVTSLIEATGMVYLIPVVFILCCVAITAVALQQSRRYINL